MRPSAGEENGVLMGVMLKAGNAHLGLSDQRQVLDLLRSYLAERGTYSDAELDFAESFFIYKRLPAHDFFQRAGTVSKYSAFVARGCLRTYVIDEGGREHIVSFAAETWWVADAVSLTNGTPSQYFIQALEDSDLLLLDTAGHERLVREVPGYAEGYQRGLRRNTAAKDARILSVMSASAQERYVDFLQKYPSIAARVPQHMVASYLGISPETLSRIRARRARRP
jgi:CRP-like cAMP-binding protein